jgi:hypothetical protein
MLAAAMRQERFFFVAKSARNHLGTDRALPHLVLLSPHRDIHTAARMPGHRGPVGKWGVSKIKRISCVCLAHLLSAGRLLRWHCARPLSLHQSRQLRQDHIMAPGPTFASSRSIAAPTSTNFAESWTLADLLIPVLRFYLRVLDRIRRLWSSNFKWAAPGG